MLLSYGVTDVKSLILCLLSGRCYCHLISGKFCPLVSYVADVMTHCGRWNCHLICICSFFWLMLLPYVSVVDV